MADHYTHFSCILDVGSAENAARAEEIRDELAAELYREEGGYPGFQMQVDHEYSPGALWIYSDDCGEPEHVIAFVRRCAEALDLQGVWGFTWCLSCSRPRVDSFGGGAHVIDLGQRKTIAWVDCNDFVSEQTTANRPSNEATT